MTPDQLATAACRGHAPVMDERHHGEADDAFHARMAQAEALCHRCPVRTVCASDAAALAPVERTGVYGGRLCRHGQKTSTSLTEMNG